MEPTMPPITRPALAILLLVATASTATSQHGTHTPHAGSPHAPHSPAGNAAPQGAFAVRSFGAFRDMVQKQDHRPRVTLGDIKASGATDAVGAVSGLRGEITMLDGRFVVSYGGGCSQCPAPHAETATLLGAGKVAAWSQPIALPADLAGKALDDFIIAQAKAAGIDTSRPFPVRLKGTLIDVAMHVIEAPNPGFSGHGSNGHMAKQDEYKHAVLSGEVVGLYAPANMQGVLSHPGEPFHFHCVDDERTRTAHLDAFGMRKGATLMLPKQ
jgi:acetolactate decarboxylase